MDCQHRIFSGDLLDRHSKFESRTDCGIQQHINYNESHSLYRDLLHLCQPLRWSISRVSRIEFETAYVHLAGLFHVAGFWPRAFEWPMCPTSSEQNWVDRTHEFDSLRKMIEMVANVRTSSPLHRSSPRAQSIQSYGALHKQRQL